MKTRIVGVVLGVVGLAMLEPAASIVYWALTNEGPGVHLGALPTALVMAAVGGGLLVGAAWVWSCAIARNRRSEGTTR